MVTLNVNPRACIFTAVITVKKVPSGEVENKKTFGADILKTLGGEVSR